MGKRREQDRNKHNMGRGKKRIEINRTWEEERIRQNRIEINRTWEEERRGQK